MNTELFIARRLFSSKGHSGRLSQRIVRLAVAGIGLGMVVMILSVAIVIGFQREVESKVNGFSAHLQVVNYDANQSYQTRPVVKSQDLLDKLRKMPGVRHVQQFITKPGMIRTNDEIQGVVLKGIGPDFDWRFFEKNKIAGEKISFDSVRSGKVWISQQLSELLKLKIGDRFRMYFLNEDEKLPRIRLFSVGGIFRTGLEEFDLMFVLADMRHLQSLNSWSKDEISGYEIFINDPDLLEQVDREARAMVMSQLNENTPLLQVVNIRDKFPEIFDWLNLLDMNVWIILILMVSVAGFNMISGLLVIILERTQMIGILKSMGAANVNIRKIFLYLSAFLVGEGLFWGNITGIVLCLIQYYLKVVHLDPASYYVSTVPIHLPVMNLVLLNAGSLLVTILMLIVPSYFVGRISPEKIIRFD